MSEGLIIVESPAKARTISRFIGNKYEVKASMGHLRDLPKSTLGVDIENNFEPKYILIKGKGSKIKELRQAAKKNKKIFLAPDPDREGEAIAWHLSAILEHDNTYRIELHEITKEALKDAMSNPHAIDINKVNAQQARRILDRLVGYKLSPLLWEKVQRGLSAGRVQSVALRLICEREIEIENFITTEYWSISTDVTEEGKDNIFRLNLIQKNNEKIQINNQQEAENIIKELKNYQFIVNSINKKETRKNPPFSYITSTLQQESFRKLNFKTSKTMQIAQQLYEGLDVGDKDVSGLITYMRTDSLRVSDKAKESVRKYIADNFGAEYIGPDRKYKVKAGVQDAHEAIRPTNIQLDPETAKKYLNNDQYRLYKLIWDRFVASFMDSAVYEVNTVDVSSGQYLLRATATMNIFKGYTAIYETLKEEDEENNEKENIFPNLIQDQKLHPVDFYPEQHFTQPPPRYSEASLIKALEEKGIGRPSTYAPTVMTIQKREYVVVEAKKLVPTKLGRIVTDLLVKNFADVFDVGFTAQMEVKLDEIEEGHNDWKNVLSEFYTPFQGEVETAKNKIEKIIIEPEETGESCPNCGKPMIYKRGRFGKFIACSGYPECKTTKAFEKDTGVNCPNEGCSGKIVLRFGKKGKFYGCSRYPDCKFATWDLPIDKKCSVCGKIMVLKTTRTGKSFIKCIDPECKKPASSDETKDEQS